LLTFVFTQAPLAQLSALQSLLSLQLAQFTPPVPQAPVPVPDTQVDPFQHPVQHAPPKHRPPGHEVPSSSAGWVHEPLEQTSLVHGLVSAVQPVPFAAVVYEQPHAEQVATLHV
jgi:hypothetical protein